MATPIVKLTPDVRKKQRALADEVGVFKYRLMEAGLILSSRAMERVVVTLGYEISAQEDGTWPDSAMKAVAGRFGENNDIAEN